MTRRETVLTAVGLFALSLLLRTVFAAQYRLEWMPLSCTEHMDISFTSSIPS